MKLILLSLIIWMLLSSAAPAQTNQLTVGIIKLHSAGLSTEILKLYIQQHPYIATSDDLILLKQNNISNEVMLEILKYHPIQPIRYIKIKDNLDMDSYDYFEHYYLYPRTLGQVNQTLGYKSLADCGCVAGSWTLGQVNQTLGYKAIRLKPIEFVGNH